MGKTLEQVMSGLSPELREEVEQWARELIEKEMATCGSELVGAPNRREGPQSGPKTIQQDFQPDEIPDSVPD